MGTARMVTAVPLPASRKKESKPLMVTFESWAGTQGALKVDWVAEWLPFVTEKGEKTRPAVSDCEFVSCKKTYS